jgi:hypothetical protein
MIRLVQSVQLLSNATDLLSNVTECYLRTLEQIITNHVNGNSPFPPLKTTERVRCAHGGEVWGAMNREIR